MAAHRNSDPVGRLQEHFRRIRKLVGERLGRRFRGKDRAEAGAEDLAVLEPPAGGGPGVVVVRPGQCLLQLAHELAPIAPPPLGRVADHGQQVFGPGVEVVFPEEVALAQDPDQCIKHFGLVQGRELARPRPAAPSSHWRTG